MTPQEESKAEAIVKSWYWQPAEGHNYKWSRAVNSLVLFYESAPLAADVAQLVIEYLRTREQIYSLNIANKPWAFQAPWTAKDAWYQTAPAERFAGTESAKVRVYWVLLAHEDASADGPYAAENGCRYKATHTYYWDVASAPELPESGSGVEYRIQGFTRDKETGLFSYIVEKRETLQQSVELYEAAETIFEKRSRKDYLGVKADKVATTGHSASASGGVMWQREVSKNADCTADVHNVKIVEKKVESAKTVTSKSLRGDTTSETHRHLTTGQVSSKTSAALKGGETRTVEKTDGGLRNLEVQKFTPKTGVLIAASVESSASVTTKQIVKQQAATDNASVTTAGANVERTQTVRKNDDGQTADVTDTERTWKPATADARSDSGGGVITTRTERAINTTVQPTANGEPNVVVETDVQPNEHGSFTTMKRTTHYAERAGVSESDSGGATHTVTERRINATEPPVLDPPQPNVVQELDVNPNEHGSATTVKRTTTFKPLVGRGKSDSGGVSTTTTTRRINAMPGTADAMGLGGSQPNVVVETDETPNDHGSVTVTTRLTRHQPRSGGGSSISRGGVSITTERKINQPDPLQHTGGALQNQIVEIENTPNDHGSFTTTKRTTTYTKQTATATSNSALETRTTTTSINDPDTNPDADEASATPNDHGTATTVKTSITPIPHNSGWITWQSRVNMVNATYYYNNGIMIFRNMNSIPSPQGRHVSLSATVNKHGLFDGSMSYSSLWAVQYR